MNKNNSKSNKTSFNETIKEKAISMTKNYLITNLNIKKMELLKFIENSIEKKIQKELKKAFLYLLISFLLVLGFLFLIYGIFSFFLSLLNFNSATINFLFGIFLIFIAAIFYFKNK